MNKKVLFWSVFLILLILILMNHFNIISINGQLINTDIHSQKIIGYCPTMKKDAINLANKNNYEILEFASSSQVLMALNYNYINKALIGRRAKSFEVNNEINEKVIKSGYTLVSNQKDFIDYNDLSLIEVHTYLSNDITKSLVPYVSNIIYHESKEDAFNEIIIGNIVLIDWDDWEDEFELVVVMQGLEKVRDFRGVFLYF